MDHDEALQLVWDDILNPGRKGGGIAVVRGFTGSGKTTLLNRLAERAGGAGMVTLYATGCPGEQRSPLSVIEQWFSGCAEARDGVAAQLSSLLAEHGEATSGSPGRDEELLVRQAQALVGDTLRDLAEQGPVVAVVDDAHYSDAASIKVLGFLSNRLRRRKVFLVLTDRTDQGKEYRTLRAAIMRNARPLVLQLTHLTHRSAAQLLHRLAGHRFSEDYVKGSLEISGGNPRLVSAIAYDSKYVHRDVPPEKWTPVLGAAFRETVSLLISAHRPESVETVARALAALGDVPSPDLLSALSGVEPVKVVAALDLLEDSGLVTGGRFRHPVMQAAVWEDTGFTGRAELSRSAARLLYESGAPSLDVARCITATGTVTADWEVSVLREAARQAKAEGRWHKAVELMESAHGFKGGADDHTELLMAVTRAKWQVDAYVAARHLADLVTAAREGRLRDRDLMLLAQMLVWHGRLDEAGTVLRLLRDRAGESPETATELAVVEKLLSLFFTGLRGADTEGSPAPDTASWQVLCRTAPPWPQAVLTTPDLMRTKADGLYRAIVGQLASAFFASGDAVAQTADITHYHFCFLLMRHVSATWPAMPQIDGVSAEHFERLSPFQESLLRGLQAAGFFAQGRLEEAEAHARVALERPQAWGVAVGLPLSVLILALIRRGKPAEVADVLNIPVPPAMLESHFGRVYLNARGQYHLATNNAYAALRDFLACGEAEQQGGYPPVPSCPWQAGIAEAYLLLDRKDEAVRMAEEAIATAGADLARLKAQALRVLALTRPVERRGGPLREAMSLLEESGDPVELAYVMDELGQVHYALGHAETGRSLMRRALRMARAGGFEGALKRSLRETSGMESVIPSPAVRVAPPPVLGTRAGQESEASEAFSALSPAEQRVAWLASIGYSNREIASKLFVTVSTIEQHLTRIYRKLKVKRREDLAAACPVPADVALL
ncbi:AAA family ATPase [Streptomyces sp. KM273126]|uniref:helix-turn-helix transcriptional regulator n=1 Tax=Streptomyces sp. KM273126 TaxID=2545247 RepID=UPI00103E96A3|nr:LuxR family transcriptional regulator [Streptomyces sp. KM273126]MBA2807340.1 AAA family ATPase [Streptomyces sp. KM273126]